MWLWHDAATFEGGVTATLLSEETLRKLALQTNDGGPEDAGSVFLRLELLLTLRTGPVDEATATPFRSCEMLRALGVERHVLLDGEFPAGMPLRCCEVLRALEPQWPALFQGEFPAGTPFWSRETLLRGAGLEGHCLFAARLLLGVPFRSLEGLRAVTLGGRSRLAGRLSGGAPPVECTTPAPPFREEVDARGPSLSPTDPPAATSAALNLSPAQGLLGKGVARPQLC